MNELRRPNTCTCTQCRNLISEDEDRFKLDGEVMCSDCWSSETFMCEHCHNRFWNDDNAGNGDYPLCQECYDDHYTTCEDCGAIISREYANYFDDDDGAYCDDCYYRRENSSIRDYSYKPNPIFYGTGNRYFGVELEIDKGGHYNDNADILLDTANAYDELIYIKSDGSLDDGMEIVTHPMTLDYHMNDMPWLEIMNKAIHMHYRSHKTETCGLHIHVNRTTFGDTREIQDERISRVLYFVEHNWEELLKFSRRTNYQMNKWAARYGYKDKPKELMEHAKKSGKGRYACVNLNNWTTIEFRMFRGTLKYNTLIATLQLVNIICDLAVNCSDEQLQEMGWTEFVSSIDEDDNRELVIYLKERRLYVNEKIEYEEDD